MYALDAGTTNLDTQTQAAIEVAVTNNLKSYGGNQPVPGAAVGVWAPGNRSFVKGFGSGQLSPQVPMSVNDKFRIGSNTKTFVVTVLLQLVQEDRLILDDTVDKFKLDVRMPDANRITIRQLAEMRSGIVDLYASPAFQALDITPQTNFDRHHWVQLALDQPRLFAPGTSYNYSNTNYMLLGMIIEAVTKDTVEHQIESRLIVPLGLRNTSFPASNPAMPSPYAHGYMLDAKKDWKDESVLLPPSVSWAAGAMISDTADMKTWVKAYVTGTVNSAATQQQRLACIPDRQTQSRLRSRHRMLGRLVRLHRRHPGIQHQRLLSAGAGRDDHRTRQQPAGTEGQARRRQRDREGYRARFVP